jgi:predicted ATP-dependent protease
VQLSGPLHGKGLLTLIGYFGGQYGIDHSLSMEASLNFEQTYDEIDGDSASSAELYVLISSIAEIPLRQDLAVTGAVDQHGRVLPIGAVNEKIEGFFDVCRQRGLSGTQGVVIPAINVKNLMLREDVVEAVRAGQFNIYVVETVDEGLELLTGKPVGERDADGVFPADSVHALVKARLQKFTEYAKSDRDEDDDPEDPPESVG